MLILSGHSLDRMDQGTQFAARLADVALKSMLYDLFADSTTFESQNFTFFWLLTAAQDGSSFESRPSSSDIWHVCLSAFMY